MLTRILSLILSVVMLTSSIQFDSESVKGFLETFEKVAESFGIELDLGETSALDITNEMIVEPQAYDDFKYSFSRQFTRVKSGCSNSALTKIYMNFSVTASGLHKANADVSNGSTTPLETSESTATHATYNCGTVGTFIMIKTIVIH